MREAPLSVTDSQKRQTRGGWPGSLARRLVSPRVTTPLPSPRVYVACSTRARARVRACVYPGVRRLPLFFRESLTEITIDRT